MKKIFILPYLFTLLLITILCVLIYAAVQQAYRTSGDDPQIELASEIKDHLEQSRPLGNIFPKDTIDLTKSLAVFVMLCDSAGQVIRSSAILNNTTPVLPGGIFEVAKMSGKDQVTWQPQKNVRIAIVAVKANTGGIKYVVVGRSLREIEVRESNLLSMVFVTWIMCMMVISIKASINLFRPPPPQMDKILKKLRRWLWFFVNMIFLSGITALPVQNELEFLRKLFSGERAITDWLTKVLRAIIITEKNSSFLFYGYDWLAFAHIVLAILFAGAIGNPVQNKWIIEFGIICCLLVIPFAMIAGYCRGIPYGWRLIDCCFGVFGLIR